MNRTLIILISVFTIVPVSVKSMEKAEDTGKTINLARTSLALVSASSCNGDRPISNGFYGVLNAFDGGSNLINKINYSYWLGNSHKEEWIEVEFSCPISIESLILEGSSQCNANLYFENGGEKTFGRIVDIIEPVPIENMISGPPPYTMNRNPISNHFFPTTNNRTLEFDGVMNGVTKVRLTFTGNRPRLTELKIMGPVPDGKNYKIGKPRLKVTKKDAFLEANDVYRDWLDKTYGVLSLKPEVTETEESFIYIYKKGKRQLLKVAVNKKNGKGKIENGENKMIKIMESKVKAEPVYSYHAVIWRSENQDPLSKRGSSIKGGIASHFLREEVSILVEAKRPGKSRITGALTVSGKRDSKCILPISRWEENDKTVYAICSPNANIPMSVISITTDEKVMTDKILGKLVSKFITEKE